MSISNFSSCIFLSCALVVSCASFADSEFVQVSLRSAGSPYVIRGFDCGEKSANTLYFEGVVEIKHPDDDKFKDAPSIVLSCENIIFGKSAKIITRAELTLQATKSISGNVVVENVRGEKGMDGVVDESIYSPPGARNGGDGRDGAGGRNAETDLKGDWDSERGGNGVSGGDGEHGVSGTRGGDGRSGERAADIHIEAGTYLPSTTVSLIAIGGQGGIGTKGGRGSDGGIGGNGGNGGSGGNANEVHDASRGGDGGKGGDGGNGGNGGRGGDGGNGGNGGNITIFITTEDGKPPVKWNVKNIGGVGGAPGLGGDPGAGGGGGKGGQAGCGGSGKDWGPIKLRVGERCGGQGADGKTGLPGVPGPAGVYGRDGDTGRTGTWDWGRRVATSKASDLGRLVVTKGAKNE